MPPTDLAFASIDEIARLFRKRKLSPVELTIWLLERIEQINPKLNAYLTVTAGQALEQARKAESELFSPRGRKPRRDRGPLHGIPISLKDNICTAGVRTTAGSKILGDFVPQHDATVVKSLKEAGAVLLGKANMHEFAYGVTSNNPHYGPVHNPWSLDRIAGGSSGGSAAAVAAGLCYASVGTDTGGSIRIPAALCGIAGLKPTFGHVSVDGVVPLSPRLDCVGPLARSARDAALVLNAISLTKETKVSSRRAKNSPKPLRAVRLGLPSEFYFDDVSEEVRVVFDRSLRLFRKLGAKLARVPLPMSRETEDAGNQIAWPEAAHYHQQAGWFPDRSSDYGEDVRSRLEIGAKVTATKYLQALEVRYKYIQQFHLALADAGVDALAVPTTPIAAPLIGEETTPISGTNHPTRAMLLRLNRPANLAGVPAISIPCGFTPEGLPVGLQLIAPVSGEPLLLHLAHSFERARKPPKRPAVAL